MTSEIALLNHELYVSGADDLEIIVSGSPEKLELWSRSDGVCLDRFEDAVTAFREIGFWINQYT